MSAYDNKTICDLVRDMEKQEEFGETTISEFVKFNMRETIERIEAYLNSKHMSGETDSMGREKPFFNLVNSMVNVWMRATDIDRKNIRVLATKQNQTVIAFLSTILLQEWMRKEKFGLFLNEWGRTLARYGSAVSKFVEKDGDLNASIVPWNRILCDAVDFKNNIVVEKLWLTAPQLKANKSYNKELVDDLLDNPTARETNDGQKKDTKNDYFLVYEVHGELPIAFLKDEDEDITDDDWEDYVQQMHVVTMQTSSGQSTDSKDYTLYKGKESKTPYHLAHLIPEDGRTLAIGAVEHLFDAQWMVNHSQKQIKDQLDLASKLLFQTSDGNFVGQNVMNNINNGDILIHNINQPLTQLNNKPDISAMQSFVQQWQAQGMQENGINEAMTQAPKSGTAWRQTQAILQEAHSLFELMTENKGLYMEEILRTYVIPHIKNKLNTSDEISALLDEQQIEQLDEMYVPNEAKRRVNEQIKKTILSGKIVDPIEVEGAVANEEQLLTKALEPLKNQRFFKPSDIESKTWREVTKELEWDLDVEITGENKDIQSTMATLTTVFQTLVQAPQALADPNVKMVFGEILQLAGGISPLQIKSVQNAPQALPQQPQQAPGLEQIAQPQV